jgi:hypothetical protein
MPGRSGARKRLRRKGLHHPNILHEGGTMAERNDELGREELEAADPLGEREFAERGFADGPPDLSAPGLEMAERRPGGGGQKVAGVAPERQHVPNTASEQRPDTTLGVIKERGGEAKGDPAIGGTRTE